MKAYTYAKLTKAAKEHAREVWRQAGYESQDWNSEDVIEDAKEQGKSLGFDIEHIYYSGFSSQGDGACFEGTWRADSLNVPEIVENTPEETTLHVIAYQMWAIRRLFPNASVTVKHNGRYSHEYSVDYTVSIANDDGDEYDTPEAERTNETLMELCRDFMRWIYKTLEKSYEYEYSDENIAEVLTSNEYEFTHSGDRIN
jgi:hypothetical protein